MHAAFHFCHQDKYLTIYQILRQGRVSEAKNSILESIIKSVP